MLAQFIHHTLKHSESYLANLAGLITSSNIMAEKCPGKTSWPELLGRWAREAAGIIKSENPNVTTIVVLTEGSVPSADFRCDRVWLWVDSYENVSQIPVVG